MPNEHKDEDHPDPKGWVTVYLETPEGQVSKTIHPGTWQVEKLKEALGVGEQLILVELTADGPTQHPDGGKVRVAEGQVFFGQTRGGGAS